MPAKVQTVPPTGRLNAKQRDFAQIVYDMRHVVFSVIRERQMPNGMKGGAALGTGFFVSSETLPNRHPLDLLAPALPHNDQPLVDFCLLPGNWLRRRTKSKRECKCSNEDLTFSRWWDFFW